MLCLKGRAGSSPALGTRSHAWSRWRRGEPVLWETMAFDPGGETLMQRRYNFRAKALVGHADTLRSIEVVLCGLPANVTETSE